MVPLDFEACSLGTSRLQYSTECRRSVILRMALIGTLRTVTRSVSEEERRFLADSLTMIRC